jgi:uncharacterized small protein (DUF1192 family)
MGDDDEVRVKPQAGLGRDLRGLSIEDLETYIADLRLEITRVEQELGKRRDVRGAADALFKPRPSRDTA